MLKLYSIKLISYVSGLISILLGLIVLIGWYAKNPALIQLIANSYPMQFNAAICFVLSGLAILCCNKKHYTLLRIICFFIALLCSLTLSQYIFTINLGIDEYFVKSFIIPFQAYPGRMSPNAATAFIILSLVLTLLSSTLTDTRKLICYLGSLLILSIGIVGVMSYLTNFTIAYGIGLWIKMAIATSFGLIILSIGLIAILFQNPNEQDSTPIIPLIVMYVILIITFIGWQTIRKNQDISINNLVRVATSNISNIINTHMRERTDGFSGITKRWINRNSTPKKEWQADVLYHINQQPGYRAIGWIDKSFQLRWIAPERPNQSLDDFNLSIDQQRKFIAEQAISKNEVQMTNLVDLLQGGKGFLLFSPIIKNGVFDGLMVGVFNPSLMMNQLIKTEFPTGFALNISDGDQSIYSLDKKDQRYFKKWHQQSTIPLYGRYWKLQVWPTTTLFNELHGTLLPNLTLFIGIFIALLSAVLLRSLQLLNRGTRLLAMTQNELLDANDHLHGIIEGSSDLIAALDLDLNFIVFNSMFKNEIYHLFKIELTDTMNFNVLLERVSKKNRKKFLNFWSKAFQGESFSVIESFNRKNANRLDYEIRYNPIKEQGRLIGASLTATNVTNRIEYEKQMALSKKELEHLVIKLEQHNKELGLLKEMISVLQACLSLEDAILPIKNYCKKILKSTSGIIYLFSDGELDTLKEITYWGEPVSHKKTIVKHDCWALLRSQTHKVFEQVNATLCNHVINSIKKPEGYFCTPLYAQGDIFGLLYMELDGTQARDFNEKLLYLSQVMSEQIALSLYNLKLRDELKRQSNQDSLTGAYNRRFFESYFEKALYMAERKHTSFAILLLDIDHFKSVNDNYGHLIGDKVLEKMTEIFNQHCRKTDLICRWGGEEFLIYLHDASEAIAMKSAETIRTAVANLIFNIADKRITNITISIGVALYPPNGRDLNSLMTSADSALYQAKNSGRNKVVLS